MNICTFRGRLTDAPELKVSGENKLSTARFTLAVPDRTKKNSEGKFDADFIRISAIGKTADVVSTYLSKGSEIIVTGRLHTYSYKKDDKTVYGAEVVASTIEFVSKCSSNDDYSYMEDIITDELPFK